MSNHKGIVRFSNTCQSNGECILGYTGIFIPANGGVKIAGMFDCHGLHDIYLLRNQSVKNGAPMTWKHKKVCIYDWLSVQNFTMEFQSPQLSRPSWMSRSSSLQAEYSAGKKYHFPIFRFYVFCPKPWNIQKLSLILRHDG